METDGQFEGKEFRRQCCVWFIAQAATPATIFVRIESWER